MKPELILKCRVDGETCRNECGFICAGHFPDMACRLNAAADPDGLRPVGDIIAPIEARAT